MLTLEKRPQIHKISREAVSRAQKTANQPFEPFHDWIPTGSGHFDKSSKDGRYRDTCNQAYYLLECEHDNEHERKYTYIYRNHLPRRNDAYFTIFYVLTKIALWKNGNKKQVSYNYFGYLHPTKFSQESTHQKLLTDNCTTCEAPRVIKSIQDKELASRTIYRRKITTKNYKIKGIYGLKATVDDIYYRSKIVGEQELHISEKELINA